MNSEVKFTLDIAEKLADKYLFEKTGKYLSDVEKQFFKVLGMTSLTRKLQKNVIMPQIL